MKDLVTVTCNEEKDLILLHAESIQKFLKPCTHWIVINETDPDINAWIDYLKPYYTKHKLNVIPRNYFPEEKELKKHHGQISQQACKILISRFIKKNYVILDTKNFFIKPFDLSELSHIIGSGIIHFTFDVPQDWNKVAPYPKGSDTVWSKSIDSYTETLNLKIKPKHYLAPMTPFVVDYALLNNYINVDTFYKDICYDKNGVEIEGISEFIFYGMVLSNFIKPGINTFLKMEEINFHTLFHHNFKNDSKEILERKLFNNINKTGKNIKIFGIHRKFLRKCGPNHIKLINEWIASLGFTFRYR